MVERKFFLDWIRVLAFATLGLFHIGMLYVTWKYNLKSPRLYPTLEWWMEATSPWRMPLLFVISGVACRFLIGKIGAKGFALNRLSRLGVVILTGMFLVNPLQVWVQLISQGNTDLPYFTFWFSHYLTSDSTFFRALGRPMPTWDHLWFLIYLLPYSLLFCGAYALLRSYKSRHGKPRYHAPLWMWLLMPAVWMSMTDVIMGTVAPFTHALVNDWGAHLKWFGLFITGTMLANRDDFWIYLRQHRITLAVVAAVLLIAYLGCRLSLRPNETRLLSIVLYRGAQGLFGWATVLAIAGFAARWLDKPSAALRYLNDAVLPVYVLHQPLMLVAAFLLFPLQPPLACEIIGLIIATTLAPLVLYHVAIRPWRIMRRLFGLKIEPRDSNRGTSAERAS